MAPTEQPVFYYDLGSPYAWLAAERIHHVLPASPSGSRSCSAASGSRPAASPGPSPTSARRACARSSGEPREYGLLPVRWPDGWPNNTLQAMRAAIFAQQTGRTVAFSLAAFRQAFAGGKDLSDVDNVLIAAAACELHPNAVLKGIELQSTKDRLRASHPGGLRARRPRRAQRRGRRRGLLGRRSPRGCRRRASWLAPDATPHPGVSRLAAEDHRVLRTQWRRGQQKTKKDAKDGRRRRGAGEVADAEEVRFGEVKHDLPDKETCATVLAKMMLIRRFEERAGEMYAKAKIGGFLHLCIGEEATVVGATQALRDTDYLMSTYREHGQALARGTEPNGRHGRAVRPRGRLLAGPRRLDAPVRLGQALPRRLRHRRRQPAALAPASRSPATTWRTRT